MLLLSSSLIACCLQACSAGPPRPAPEVDCSVEDAYDFSIQQDMEGSELYWFGFDDEVPGSSTVPSLQQLPTARCGSTRAMLLTARGHTDWGAGFGEYHTAQSASGERGARTGYLDASGYEGVSFWARATGYGTSSGFLLSINDRYTGDNLVCVEPSEEEVAAGGYTYNEAGMTVPVGGALPSPDDCGNAYQRPVIARREWYLHTLPFESFLQTPNPNRSRTGIDRSALYSFAINIPKDANIELWIDDLGLYRHRASEPGAPAQAAP